MYLLKKALEAEEASFPAKLRKGYSYWGKRTLVPTYAAALAAGAFADGQDSAATISAERDGR